MTPRQFQRVRHKIPALVTVTFGTTGHATSMHGIMRDVSVCSLCVAAAESGGSPLAPGARARVIFERSGRLENLVSQGNIVRSTAGSESAQQIAVRFERVRYDIVAALRTVKRVVVEVSPYGFDQPTGL